MNKLVLFFLTILALPAVCADAPDQCSVLWATEHEEQVLAQFSAKVGEEVATLKTYDIERTKLKAMVRVGYTDESIRIQVSPKYVQDISVQLAVVVAENPKEADFEGPNSSVAEAAIVSKTDEKNLLRVTKFVNVDGKKAALVFECREK